MSATPGLPVRRAALRLLDAVFRRGETLEQAEAAALGDVRKAPDRALAKAIAGESLRWLTDLDALIEAARLAERIIGRTLVGHVMHSGSLTGLRSPAAQIALP